MSKHKKIPPSSLQPSSSLKSNEGSARFAIAASHFSGPIPPPEMLRKYEEICPGSADRIIAMAENQSRHRQDLESKVVTSNCSNERLGMIFGFIVCVLAISVGAYLILHGKNTSGLVAIITAIAGPAGVFIWGKSRQKRELEHRRKGMTAAATDTQA